MHKTFKAWRNIHDILLSVGKQLTKEHMLCETT